MKLWKRILLKVPKVGLAYRAYRWWRVTRRYRLVKLAKTLRKVKRLLRKVKTEDGYMSWMDGKKTYAGIAVVVLGMIFGWLGIGSEADAETLVGMVMSSIDSILEVIGTILAIYGRMKAKPKAT